MNKKILLMEGIQPFAKKYFEKKGFQVDIKQSSSTEKELLSDGEYVALGIRSRTKISNLYLSQTKELLCVGAFCIGIDQIDLEGAVRKGIAVFNSPYSNTRSVAELVIANIVNLSRQVMRFNQLFHKGQWKKTSQGSFEVRGKTLGIIGYGHIGSQVGILAEALGLKVFYYDIQKKLSFGNVQAVDSLQKLLSISDFVTLHVPQTPQTKNMITKKELQIMREGSYIINTSRGSTVCLEDLYESLKAKHINGAAIDVFPEEPSGNKEEFKNDLQKLENVVLTPHIGGSTEEAQINIAQDVAGRLKDYIVHGDSSGSVNFPNISPLPKKETCSRISNIHKNISGSLTKINTIISNLNLNVENQHLSTIKDIGYLIIDVQSHDTAKVKTLINQIQQLDTSIRTRQLQ